MLDFIIGVFTTIISTLLIGLWGILIINPYKTHLTIYKKTLGFIRNFEDPRRFEGQLAPKVLQTNCIKRQIEELEEILDLIEEQKDLNRFWYWLFSFKNVSRYLNTIYEYIRNPIMLNKQKEFKDDYILDCNLFFKKLKKIVKIPNWKVLFLLILVTVLITSVVIVSIYIVNY